MSARGAIRQLLVASTVGVCLLCGVAWSLLVARRLHHSIKFDFGQRSEMDELQAPISDSAFYLSYFYDVARAPSLSEGVGRLLRDDRSEAPDQVNALHKFNVAPELFVASLHRLAGVAMSPYAFYVWSVVAFGGLGVVAMALTASLVGGSVLCGLAAGSLFFSLCYSPSLQAGTRFGGSSLALREFWGVPALFLQNAVLVLAVSSPDAGRPPYLVLLVYVACTSLFELCWQFAPFVLLLQMLSLLGTHVVLMLPRRRLGEVALAAVMATLLALVVSFGNRMLLCSPFFALAGSLAVVGLSPAPVAWVGKDGLGETAWVFATAVCSGAVVQQMLKQVASEQEDRHVLQLLLQKLGLASPAASFDAFLYLQSPEFGFLSMQYVREASSALVVPAAGLASMLILAAVVRRRLVPGLRRQQAAASQAPRAKGDGKRQQVSASPGPKQKSGAPLRGADNALAAAAEERAPWSAWVAQLLFLVALLLLAGLVNRLRVVAAPALCIVGSLAASPLLWAEAAGRGRATWSLAHALGVALVVAPPHFSGAAYRVLEVGEMLVDEDMYELVRWVNESLPAGALFAADMTMAAKFRMISPTVRVANHPQYESVTSRQRNRAYYRTFTCASPGRVHKVLSRYGVTHVLLNANACRARMGKLDAFVHSADQCGQLPNAELQQKTFCWGGFLSQQPGVFEMVFRNPIYTVLRLGDPTAGRGSARSATGMASSSTWRPWLAGTGDFLAARALARAAASWPQKYGGFEVAEVMLDRANELAGDDPIVVLQRGKLQTLRGDEKGAYDSMAEAAKRAGKAARSSGASRPEDMFQVYHAWKKALMNRGAKRGLATLQRLARSLRPHLERTSDAFNLCDLAGWLKDWGDMAQGAEFWAAAKAVSLYDSCVREDWASWEGRELTTKDTWRAFLGW